MNRYAKNIAIVAIVVLVAVALHGNIRPEKPQVKWKYNKFVSEVEKGRVNSGELSKTQFAGETKRGQRFYVPLLESEPKADIRALLLKHHVIFENKNQGFTDSLGAMALSFVLPVALLIFFWFIIMRQAQMGGNQAIAFGRSRAKRLSENVPKVTFEDVAGVDEAKQELEEVVEFLRNPKKFQSLGAKIPKGVLLLGPPGCGKTLLARAIAGEAGVPFFHISGSDFVEMFVGVGASRVRDLFDTAKANRPSLIFIDEIDAVGRQRGAGLGGGHDEREQTLNQLLVEMDGFDPNAGVILIAATNRPDVLDPALLRPGRFDRRIVVDNPDANGRRAILGIHTRGKPLSENVKLESLARRTPGFSGADIANLVNEAALLAARRNKTNIEMVDMEDSIDRVVAGPERKSRIISDKEKEMVAYHEVGHAIVLEVLPLADPVHKVSVLPRGMALGYTMQLPLQDKYLTTKSELLDDVAGLLGGRVCEQLVFNEVTTGANNDLDRATDIARSMVCEFGMSETLGPLTLGRRHGNPFLGRDIMEDRNYSEEIAMSIDKEVRKIIDHAYERAKEILSSNRQKMDEIVRVLLEKETLERDEFEVLMYGAVRTPSERGESETTLSPGEGEACAEPSPTVRPERKPRLEPGVA
ncbi:MAG: ATP-dependent zinc metalloprotease FtsH [Armatimonadota bacterium]|nr:ATP-dependent zinc metalloprotease FtsH [Armatimonadota bacterium]